MSGDLSAALEETYRESLNSEKHFANKCILHIGSESYDAQTVTVCQGLDKLGFEIHTPVKPNINSWWCNKVIRDPRQYKYDFVLSSLHWGTRWSHIGRYGLYGYPKVLIDGDDDQPGDTWYTKYERYLKAYKVNPPEEVKAQAIAPYRWAEPLDGYKPDVVFVLAKQFPPVYRLLKPLSFGSRTLAAGTLKQLDDARAASKLLARGAIAPVGTKEIARAGMLDKSVHYIPKGIQHQWLDQDGSKTILGRAIDFCHIPGPGAWRQAMSDLLDLGALPGKVHNAPARGKAVYPSDWVRSMAEKDAGVHSWDRWAMYMDFYRILDDTKVLIHPGIDHWPFWEARRIYEGWACGCLVMMSEPTVDVSEYPPTGVCPGAVYASHEELISKAQFWYRHPEILDSLAVQGTARARRYFSPTAVARYFLWKVSFHI